MPNHCSNTTVVYGSQADVARFIEAVTSNDEIKLAENLYPMPEELKDTTATLASPEPHPNWAVLLANGEITQEWHDHLVQSNAENWALQQHNRATFGYSDWYEWANAHWGTKWGDYDNSTVPEVYANWRGDGLSSSEFVYTTAWAPFSEGFWEKVSTDWPTLSFVTSFEESGGCFVGSIGAKNGTVITVDGEWPDGSVDWDDDESVDSHYEAVSNARDDSFDRVVSAVLSPQR